MMIKKTTVEKIEKKKIELKKGKVNKYNTDFAVGFNFWLVGYHFLIIFWKWT